MQKEQSQEFIDPWRENEFYETVRNCLPIRQIEIINHEVNSPPAEGRYLTVVLVSDTHDQMRNLLGKLPDGDVLIHAGDFTNAGGTSCIKEFNEVMGQFPHKYKLVVAGNHELGFDDTEDWDKREKDWIGQGTHKGYELLTNVTWLHDRAIEIEGKVFYGSSWHPLQGYPFSRMRGPEMEEVWARMPEKVDVVITHTPPLGYLDTFNQERWGCRHLGEQIKAKKPELHVFGHVHECYGAATNGQTTFVNAALCNKKNQLENSPLIYYLPID